MTYTSYLARLKAATTAFRASWRDNAPEQGPCPVPIAWSVGSADQAWLTTVDRVLREGSDVGDRTGTGTRAIFGHGVRIPLTRSDGTPTLPVVSIKKTNYSDAIFELQWMLSGSNSLVPLIERGIHIWTDWPLAAYVRETGESITRDEFETRVLGDPSFAERFGKIDPCYGTQMRHYPTASGPFDQMTQLLNEARANPRSRRLIWNLWTPAMTIVKGGTGLPPCHYEGQISIINNRLSIIVTMRSWDIGLGMSYNVAQYGWLAHTLAKMTGTEPGDLIMISHDTHLYLNHIEPIKTVLDREVRPDPAILLGATPSGFDDLQMDFEIEGYQPQPFLRLPVAV